jgi:hypothetical protein
LLTALLSAVIALASSPVASGALKELRNNNPNGGYPTAQDYQPKAFGNQCFDLQLPKLASAFYGNADGACVINGYYQLQVGDVPRQALNFTLKAQPVITSYANTLAVWHSQIKLHSETPKTVDGLPAVAITYNATTTNASGIASDGRYYSYLIDSSSRIKKASTSYYTTITI